MVQIYKVDDELGPDLRDDYEAKVAAAAQEAGRPGRAGLSEGHPRAHRRGQDPSSPSSACALRQPAGIDAHHQAEQALPGRGRPGRDRGHRARADAPLSTLMPPTNEWWRHERNSSRAPARAFRSFRRDRPPIDDDDEQSRLVQGSTVSSVYRVTPTSRCNCMCPSCASPVPCGTCFARNSRAATSARRRARERLMSG